MKKFITRINFLISVCVVLLIVCFCKINALENRIESYNNNNSSYQSNISNDIQNTYSNIENLLNEEASIFSYTSYNIGEFNQEDFTLPVIIKVAPKEYTKDTKAAAICNGSTYDMNFDEGYYTGTVLVLPFSKYDENKNIIQVVFSDGDKRRSEQLEIYDVFLDYAILRVNADFSGNTSSSTENKEFRYTLNGDINVETYNMPETVSIKSCKLYVQSGGKTIFKKNIKNSLSPPEERSFYGNFQLNETFKIKAGNSFKIYVETVDSRDIRYENIIYQTEIDKHGEVSGTESGAIFYDYEKKVYDSKGNLIMSGDY